MEATHLSATDVPQGRLSRIGFSNTLPNTRSSPARGASKTKPGQRQSGGPNSGGGRGEGELELELTIDLVREPERRYKPQRLRVSLHIYEQRAVNWKDTRSEVD